MQKVLIISCNDSYDYNTRTKYVKDFFDRKCYDTEFLIADFDHRYKKAYTGNHEGPINYIHINSYKKNISIGRVVSQVRFAIGVYKFCDSNPYDIIYHCAPPNSTIAALHFLRKKKKFLLITEIGDMWPESIPISDHLKKIFALPLRVWADLRDNYISNSDCIITECELFRKQILEKNRNLKVNALYFCSEYKESNNSIDTDKVIQICYLGSINNIIDISFVVRLCGGIACKKNVVLHVIGDGENRNELIEKVSEAGAKVVFHGMIFDENEKTSILHQCQFGLNIMKNTVCVGMTMKSMDYLSHGLPLINNIEGDIWDIVEKEKIGYNINDNTLETITEKIVKSDSKSIENLRNNVKRCHNRHFSKKHYFYVMDKILNSLGKL